MTEHPRLSRNPTIETGQELLVRNDGTVTDADLTAQHRAFLAAATSDNTRRAYRSAIRHFLAWGGVLPSDEPAMIRYLLAYAQALGSSQKTVNKAR